MSRSGFPPVTPPTGDVINALLGLCGDFLATIAQNPLGTGFDTVKVVAETLYQGLQSGNFSPALLIDLVNNILSGAPELRSILTADYGKVMAASWPSRTVADLSFRVMDGRFRPQFGSPDVPPPRVDATGAYSIELFLPTEVTGGTPPVPYYIGFIDEVIRLINAATGTFVLGYIGVRFTGPTRAFLGMQQWNQTCSVEISTLPNVNGELDLLTNILDLIYDFPKDKAQPVPHWGQLIDLNIQGYGDRYPNYAKWQSVYSAMSNNFANRTFENDLSKRWQLTSPPRYMQVQAKFLGRNAQKQVTVAFTVTDSSTDLPVAGAEILIYDEDFTPPAKKADGVTGADGTLKLIYLECLDPETKTPLECSGRARKERYQDVHFVTPYK